MDKNPTMKEIAELAGVSTATVSRVINHNGRFSKDTEARVWQVIQENNYVINETAKGLRKNKTQTIGIVVPDITNPHFANIVLNVQKSLFNYGYSCIICNTNESQEMEDRNLEALKAQHVSGFLLVSSRRFHASLRKFPTVYIDRPGDGGNNEDITVESDNFSGGHMAGEQLVMAGCHRIVIVRVSNDDYNEKTRTQGCLKALKEHGIDPDSVRQINVDEATVGHAYSRMLMETSNGLDADGIMTTTDTVAAGVYAALRDRNIRVPEDMKMTGYDDSGLAMVTGPGITSIRQDTGQMADIAVDLLVRQMRGEQVETYHYYLPVSVTIRRSTSLLVH